MAQHHQGGGDGDVSGSGRSMGSFPLSGLIGGDGAPMDETPSNTSLLSFDMGGITPGWLARGGASGPDGSAGRSGGLQTMGSLASLGLGERFTETLSPSVAPYLESLMSPPTMGRPAFNAGTPAPTPEEAEALENWSRLARRPFSGATTANAHCRLFARRLGESVTRLLGTQHCSRPIGDLGAAGHALIERAAGWSVPQLRGVVHLVERLERSHFAAFEQFLDLVADLELASRPPAPPSPREASGVWASLGSSFSLRAPGRIPSPRSAPKANTARAFYEAFVKNVSRSADNVPFALLGYIVVDYDQAEGVLERQMIRLRTAAAAAALLGPARPRADGKFSFAPAAPGAPASEIHFDPTYCGSAPPAERDVLATPGGLVAAILDHNAFEEFSPSPQHTREVRHVYEAARRSNLCYAAWLSPFDVHLTPAVTMRCQQCYGRDPHVRATAFALTGVFLPRGPDGRPVEPSG